MPSRSLAVPSVSMYEYKELWEEFDIIRTANDELIDKLRKLEHERDMWKKHFLVFLKLAELEGLFPAGTTFEQEKDKFDERVMSGELVAMFAPLTGID